MEGLAGPWAVAAADASGVSRVTAGVEFRAVILAAVLAATGLSGCVSAGITAVADGVDGVGTFVGGATKGAPRQVQIFVASTRPEGKDRTTGIGGAHFSLTTISVPPGHRTGSIERPSLGSENRLEDFVLAGRRPLDETGFRNEIASHISGRIGSNRDILVFVHGFNTSLDEARFRLAQIVIDGGFNGVPVLFTWPSKGSLFGYGSDREAAMASRDALEHLLETLAAEPDVGKIHVLAHSMGAWLAMESLRENAIAGHPDLDGHLGDILLAAPDIDLDVFRAQMARLGSFAHVSIFTASNDRALAISSMLADRPRLGALDPSKPADLKAIKDLGVDVIDVSRDSVGLIGHATYAAAPEIIRGIGAELGAKRPEDRDTQAVLDGTEAPAGRLPDPHAPIVAMPLPAPVLPAPAAAVPPPVAAAPAPAAAAESTH